MSTSFSASILNSEPTEATCLVIRHDKRYVSLALKILAVFATALLVLTVIVAVLVGCHLIVAPMGLAVWGLGASVGCLTSTVLIFCLYKKAGTLIKLSRESVGHLTKDESFPGFLKKRGPTERITEVIERTPSRPTTPISDAISEEDDSDSWMIIKSNFYRNDKVDSRSISQRLASLKKEVQLLIKDFSRVSQKDKIKSTIQQLLLPSMLRRGSKDSFFNYLIRLEKVIETYSPSEMVLLFLTEPEIGGGIFKKLLVYESSSGSEKNEIARYLGLINFINLWCYGWFLEEKCIKKISTYNPNLLTDEAKVYLETGNIVQFLLSLQTQELQNQVQACLLKYDIKIFSAKDMASDNPGINILAYLQEEDWLLDIKDSLDRRLRDCKSLVRPSNALFAASVTYHRSKLQKLCEFFELYSKEITGTPFMVLELLFGDKYYQLFIKDLLEKAMPISVWKSLLRPWIMALCCSGIVTQKELEILAKHIQVSLQDLTKGVASGTILDLLLKHTFKA